MIDTHELNLLPPARRQQLAQDSHWAFLATLGQSLVMGLSALTALGAILLGVFWSTRPATVSDAAEQAAISQYQNITQQISQTNERLKTIDRYAQKRVPWAQHLHDLFAQLPPTTTVTELRGDSEQNKLVIRGQAPTREALDVLKEQLKKLSWVKTVDAPVSNLLQKDNPRYEFTLTLVP